MMLPVPGKQRPAAPDLRVGAAPGSNPSPPLSAEEELLLCCARSEPSAEQRARIRELAAGNIDWTDLQLIAAQHRVMPLLCMHLGAEAEDLVPGHVLAGLRKQFAQNAKHSLLLTMELQAVTARLAAEGIPLIPYKGPVLAQQLYGNVAHRQMSDLDVLIPPAALAEASRVLRSLGYVAVDLSPPGIEHIILRSEANIGFVRPDLRITLEVHWAFTAGRFAFPLAFEELLPGLTPVRVANAELTAVDPSHLMLILCFHGTKHMWERVEWITGVAELARSPEIDWAFVLARSANMGCRRMLLLGLALARDLLNATVPEPVIGPLRADRRVDALVSAVRARLFHRTDQLAHTAGLAFHRFQIGAKERLRERIRYAWYSLAAPEKEDWLALPLPDMWYPIYYLVRPFRLAGRYGMRLTRSRA